ATEKDEAAAGTLLGETKRIMTGGPKQRRKNAAIVKRCPFLLPSLKYAGKVTRTNKSDAVSPNKNHCHETGVLTISATRKADSETNPINEAAINIIKLLM